MTDNDYIAEYVKERCPELLDTVDFNVWRFRMALSDLIDDNLSKIGGKLNATESEEED